MSRTVVVYGRFHTTAYMFIHVLGRLLERHAAEAPDLRVHLVLDDRRDLGLARSVLPPGRVAVEAQFESQDPFGDKAEWPPATVERWERRYGDPNLRVYMENERALQGFPDRVRWGFLLSQIEYFERLWERVRPELFVSGAADGLSTWVAMAVFRANGVRCLSFTPCRFGARSFAIDNPYEVLNIARRYKALLADGLDPGAERFVRGLQEQYRHGSVKPLEHLALHATRRRRRVPSPLSALRLMREGWFTDARNFDLPLRAALARAVTARRTWLHDLYLSRHAITEPVEGERFFFFPLHLEPESSLITQGRGWTDQLHLIRLISDSLPIDRWLYVKEHPSMPSGIRPLRFYREILSLPGVRLLSQRVTSRAVIPHAEAVLTITGTAGWEALMLGKPVVLFGHAFYEEFEEGVTVLGEMERLPDILRELRHRVVAEKALLAFTAAVAESAPEGILSEPRLLPALAPVVMDETNLDRLTRMILDRLNAGAVGAHGS